MFYIIEPDIAGGLGEGTIMDSASRPFLKSIIDLILTRMKAVRCLPRTPSSERLPGKVFPAGMDARLNAK